MEFINNDIDLLQVKLWNTLTILEKNELIFSIKIFSIDDIPKRNLKYLNLLHEFFNNELLIKQLFFILQDSIDLQDLFYTEPVVKLIVSLYNYYIKVE